MPQTNEQTRAFLTAHQTEYPLWQVQDVLKALYQSAFGCEHMAGEEAAVLAAIRLEAEQALKQPPKIEKLDGPYSRVHLSYVSKGLAPETLARLFVLSVRHRADGTEALQKKLTVFQSLVAEGALPFDAESVEAAVQTWRAAGFPAIRHSDMFRQHYAPAYRVIESACAHYLPLFAGIDRLMRDGRRLTLAIDGRSTAGKTTLAAMLEKVYGCNVFHMDDFFLRPEQRTPERYREPGGNVDRERFLREVLLPLKTGETIAYRRFDCARMALTPSTPILPRLFNVVEGAYSLHPDLRSHYDCTVFLDIGPALQRKRILHREGPEYTQIFMEKWVPLEEAYFAAFQPQKSSDFVFEALEG